MAVGAGGDPLDTIERLLAAPSPSRLRPSPRVLHAPWVAFDLRSTRFGAPTSEEEWPQPRGGVIDVTGQAALPIGSLHIEMPRFNERRHGAPYRYIWGVGAPLGVSTHVSGLVKVDLGANNHREEKEGQPLDGEVDGVPARAAACTSWYRRAHYPSEPIFVPRPGAMDEDDGVLLSVMLDGEAATSYLLVLNATTMQTLATAYAPVVMPTDFHGEWFDSNASDADQKDAD